jgi:large subunit ribosomal protein L4
VKRLARKSAFSLKSQEKALMVVEDFNFESPKTKEYISFLASLGIEDKKSLVVLGDNNDNVFLSSRNFKKSEVITNDQLSTYKIMNAKSVVLLEGAVEQIQANLTK